MVSDLPAWSRWLISGKKYLNVKDAEELFKWRQGETLHNQHLDSLEQKYSLPTSNAANRF